MSEQHQRAAGASAVAEYLDRLGMFIDSCYNEAGDKYHVRPEADDEGYESTQAYRANDMLPRERLAHASDADWRACVRLIRAAVRTIPAWRRPLLATLLPDEPGLAKELAAAARTPESRGLAPWYRHDAWLKAYATPDSALKALRRRKHAANCGAEEFCDMRGALATLLQDRGPGAATVLSPLAWIVARETTHNDKDKDKHAAV